MISDTDRMLYLFAVCCFTLTVILVLAAIMSGIGTRMNWWGFRTGFSLLRWAAYGELAVFAAALIGCILAYSQGQGNGLFLFVVACVISIAAVSVPLRMYLAVRSLPAIHDITTDTENPPQFVAVLALRKSALNPVEYGGPEIARQQKMAYPDIAPLILDAPPARIFEHALAFAVEQRWTIINADAGSGLIEATDTTFWFGFKDDIVIRIAPLVNGSRTDIRSLSRVGKSDVGANAKRIRAFIKRLKSSG